MDLIRELAAYENLSDHVDASAAALGEHLFGATPVCQALVASQEGVAGIVGYALFFPTYSSFKTSPSLFLEDLYVTTRARGQGHGKALLAAVAAEARARGFPRLDWNVLSCNRPAIEFYASLGAPVLEDWRVCRLQGEALARLAAIG